MKKILIKENEAIQAPNDSKSSISINRKLKLMGISKNALYYKNVKLFSSQKDQELLNTIDRIYTVHPYYRYRRVLELLKRLGFNVGKKKVITAMKHMGLRAIYPETISEKKF